MSVLSTAKINSEELFWDELSNAKAVMVGCEDSGHLQPMAPNIDRDKNLIWFVTKSSSDLAKACGRGNKATLCWASEKGDFHGSVFGELREHKAQKIIDQYWSPMVAAWFEGGREDPEVTMLIFEPSEAAIWASTDSSIKFAWEIAKANVRDTTPDIGYHVIISISSKPVSTAMHINGPEGAID